ncbi:MAG: hypothetical protein ABMA15_06140 [Vicinamibacterales bacterium]
MRLHRTTVVWLMCLTTACSVAVSAAGSGALNTDDASQADAASLFRVFLKDGQSLVSYGEFARLDDRVVFSMPTSSSVVVPQLQLISIPSERVDWSRTLSYAETVRATAYLRTRAESDYAALTSEVARSLNAVGLTADPGRRLSLIEGARKTLAEWPANHYNYRYDEIQQMLGALDEAIGDLRAASGSNTFALSLVAVGGPPPATEPLLPAPGAREAIEGTLAAAAATTTPAERVSLLMVAVGTLDAERRSLSPDWAAATRTETLAEIAREQEIDRKYQSLATRLLPLASARAAAADVRGVERILTQIATTDAVLGSVRPDAVASLVAAVEVQLDTARRVRLEREHVALRAVEFRTYRTTMAQPLARLQRVTRSLEDIKALAGSSPDALGRVLYNTGQIQKSLATIEPPSELRDAHSLFVSAVQLADNAARIRREAAIAGNLSRAWDASSAAAGALMLADRARQEMQVAMRPPQLAP